MSDNKNIPFEDTFKGIFKQTDMNQTRTARKLRVLSVFGTRPEAIKMAPVVKALSGHPKIESKICVTAQHRQMLDQILELFQIKPDFDLNLMQTNQSLAQLSASIFTSLDPILVDTAPDWILLQGDTTTVSIAALLGYYRRIHVGHIEAGLRSHDKWAPFPEEINRRIASVIADLHFAPTEGNRQNLLKEGVPDSAIVVTGNPIIDAINYISTQPEPAQLSDLLHKSDLLNSKKRLVLITAHRRENFGQPILDICSAIKKLAHLYYEDTVFIYPVHLNPNIQEPVYRELSGISNLHLVPPLDYLEMVHLMKNSYLILTDSGGIQEEATSMSIPTLVLRKTTERPEGVTAGILKLVGSNPELIFDETCKLLNNTNYRESTSNADNPFGDGHAAEHILKGLLEYSTENV